MAGYGTTGTFLRPLSLHEILSFSLGLYLSHFIIVPGVAVLVVALRAVLGVVAAVAVAVVVAVVLLRRSHFPSSTPLRSSIPFLWLIGDGPKNA